MMKNKVLLFLFVLFLFVGCKKKRERIEPYLGTWIYAGSWSRMSNPRGTQIYDNCAKIPLKFRILSNNRFISYDSLDNVLCRGRIEYLIEGQGKIIIRHNLKKGQFYLSEHYGGTFCNIPKDSRILNFETLLEGGYVPENSLFFDGNAIGVQNAVFYKK